MEGEDPEDILEIIYWSIEIANLSIIGNFVTVNIEIIKHVMQRQKNEFVRYKGEIQGENAFFYDRKGILRIIIFIEISGDTKENRHMEKINKIVKW